MRTPRDTTVSDTDDDDKEQDAAEADDGGGKQEEEDERRGNEDDDDDDEKEATDDDIEVDDVDDAGCARANEDDNEVADKSDEMDVVGQVIVLADDRHALHRTLLCKANQRLRDVRMPTFFKHDTQSSTMDFHSRIWIGHAFRC